MFQETLDLIGHIKADVSAGNSTVSTNFILVKHGLCILGNVTTLGVLRIGPNGVPPIDCNALQDDIASELKAKYTKVFEGIRQLKDFKLKLQVNQTAPPAVQNLSRVPFPLHDRVTATIKELLKKDFIECTEGPTRVCP